MFLILFGVLGKIGGLVLAIPAPILGGVTTYLFGAVATSGLAILAKVKFTRRICFVVAAALGPGAGWFTYFFTYTGIVGHNDNAALRQGVPIVSTKDWAEEALKARRPRPSDYFPLIHWLPSYNQWSLGDLISEYGLDSSFVGVMIYALFATSKDATIGPVAVMFLQVGNTITLVLEKHPNQWSGAEIASAVAFLCGYLPGHRLPPAITIAAGQVPKLLRPTVTANGVSAYKVIIDLLKALPQPSIPPLRTFFIISVLSNAFVIIVLNIASKLWLNKYNVGKKPKYPISILKDVPRGFKHMGQPNLSTGLLSAIAPELSVSVIVLLLEHIAIAQSFGRVNNYKINPNQKLMAIGVTNMVGTCFGAYAATGSFSRTAIKAKSGVRTPIAGWVTAIVVVIAIYALTGTFYWIPQPALSAVIIHAIGDLIAPPSAAYQFWLVQSLDFFIFMAGVITTFFTAIDIGIYVTIASLLALLLASQRNQDENTGEGSGARLVTSTIYGGPREVFVPLSDKDGLRDPSIHVRLPLPGVLVYRLEDSLLYSNASAIADVIVDKVKFETRPATFRAITCAGARRRGSVGNVDGGRPTINHSAERDAPWYGTQSPDGSVDTRPVRRALIFDFSSVCNVDTTSIQALVDVRRSVERYTG
ncbi:hypothetical protein V8E36_008297 [Tilletia maclaganii]